MSSVIYFFTGIVLSFWVHGKVQQCHTNVIKIKVVTISTVICLLWFSLMKCTCTIVHVPMTVSAAMNFLFFFLLITFNKSTKVYPSLVIIMDFWKQGNEIGTKQFHITNQQTPFILEIPPPPPPNLTHWKHHWYLVK